MGISSPVAGDNICRGFFSTLPLASGSCRGTAIYYLSARTQKWPFKLCINACASAKPGLLGAPLAYTAPLAYSSALAYAAPAAVVAAPAPVVTATSSQVIARNYNGIAAAPVIAPVAAPLAAPVIAKYAAAPLSAPVIAKYAAAPLAAPLAYSSPLAYSAPLSYASVPSPLLI